MPNMATITRDLRQTAMYNIILFIVLAISYRFIPYSIPCPDCVLNYETTQVIEEKIIYQNVGKQENICLENYFSYIVIIPCYSNNASIDVTKMTHITRDYLDSIGVDRNPKMRIETPMHLKFDNLFSEVHFSRSAAQYYFPNIRNMHNVVTRFPGSIIKNLTTYSNTCTRTLFCYNEFICESRSDVWANSCTTDAIPW